MNTIGTVVTPDGAAFIDVGYYPNSSAILVELYRMALGGWASRLTFSVDLKSCGCPLADDEFNVKSWCGQEALFRPMLDTGLFEDTGRSCVLGFALSPIWRLRDAGLLPDLSSSTIGVAA